MKRILIFITVITLATSFKYAIDKTNAIAEQKEGLTIFAYSKPFSKYDILGMVKIKGIVSSETAPHMVKLLIEKAKKEFPSGEAIIINSEFDKAEVIKFKN